MSISICFSTLIFVTSCKPDNNGDSNQNANNQNVNNQNGFVDDDNDENKDPEHPNHVFGEWIVTSDPDCGKYGEQERYCTCGEKEIAKITALVHELDGGVCSHCGAGYSDGLEFRAEGSDKCYVRGIGSFTGSDLIIPTTALDGRVVVGIDSGAFEGCESITSVYLSSNVETIRGEAFSGCINLESVTLNDGLVEIDTAAFRDCPIIEISIPGSVEEIGNSAFKNCIYLTRATIGSDSFGDAKTDIYYKAFEGCMSLSAVFIGNNVKSIGTSAFEGCQALASVNIPSSLESIGGGAFKGCTSLTDIIIPGSVEDIATDAFSGCTSLASVTLNDGLVEIGSDAFRDCPIIEINIPESVELIGYSAFKNCIYLTKATIGGSNFGETETDIYGRAFEGCTSLSTLVIGNNVKSIGSSAFLDCKSLASVTIPGSVMTIAWMAFGRCEALENVVIEDSSCEGREIHRNTFLDCTKFDRIYFTGTADDWEQIVIDSTDNYPLNVTPYFYSYSEPVAPGNYWYYNGNNEPRVWNVSKEIFTAEMSSELFTDIFGEEDSSQAKLLYNQIKNSSNFQSSLRNWEGMYFVGNTSVTDNGIKISKKDLYKLVLFDLLCGEENAQETILDTFNHSSFLYIDDLAKEIFGCKMTVEELNGSFEVNIMRSNIDYIQKTIGISSSAINIVFETSKNSYEALKTFATYKVLSDMDQAFRDVLLKIAEDTSNPKELREAASEYASVFGRSAESILAEYETDLKYADTKAVIKVFLDCVWDNTLNTFLPGVALGQTAAKGVLWLSDVGFNVDAVYMAYYKLETSVTLESSLRKIISAPLNDYFRDSNRAEAETYVYAIELYKRSVLLGFDYSSTLIREDGEGLFVENRDEYANMLEIFAAGKQNKIDNYTMFDNLVSDAYNVYYS